MEKAQAHLKLVHLTNAAGVTQNMSQMVKTTSYSCLWHISITSEIFQYFLLGVGRQMLLFSMSYNWIAFSVKKRKFEILWKKKKAHVNSAFVTFKINFRNQ